MRLIDADRLLTERMKSTYYHLPNGDIAIPIIDIEHAPTICCKDCTYALRDNRGYECFNSEGIYQYVSGTDFCSKFVKHEEEEFNEWMN